MTMLSERLFLVNLIVSLLHLNYIDEDLEVMSQFGKIWQIRFAPTKTFSLLISLKRDFLPNPLPPLTIYG